MQIRTTALTIFLVATTTNTVFSEGTEDAEIPTLCYDYSDLRFDLEPNACKSSFIIRKFREVFTAKAANGERCRGGMKRDLMALTGTTTFEGAVLTLHDMCTDALATAANDLVSSGWNLGVDVDLEKFFDGNGFLNEETGNFKQSTDSFIKRGGEERFLSISEDPRENDHYATSEESYNAGLAINNLFEERSKKEYFEKPTGGFNCASNTVMCCWGRDRQYFDNNGSCKFGDCAHENPGDNTDLCWTEEGGDVFPYPGDKIEDDLHCHGISWGDDTDSGKDINAKARWNNLFYVSMYDHLYQRGYVEAITNDPQIAGSHAMCDCVEEMPVVARADCSEVVGKASYTVTVVDDEGSKRFLIAHTPDTFELEFQACEGYKFVDDFTPDDYALDNDTKELSGQNNDLAAFVFRQYLERKLDEAQVATIEETLIGYRNPDVNKSDAKRNEACQAAFEKEFPGLKYEAKVLTGEVEI